jgi:quercetin dioxygenase-like cupin family protein
MKFSGCLLALAAIAAGAPAFAADTPTLSESQTFKYSDLAVRKFDNGGEQRRILAGTLATGEFLESHLTVLPAGQMPHPPHAHSNSEMVFIQTGNVEYIDAAGKHTPLGPGDIIFTASNKVHGLINVGKTASSYIVVSISKQDTPH